jgi:hypothetical protein
VLYVVTERALCEAVTSFTVGVFADPFELVSGLISAVSPLKARFLLPRNGISRMSRKALYNGPFVLLALSARLPVLLRPPQSCGIRRGRSDTDGNAWHSAARVPAPRRSCVH